MLNLPPSTQFLIIPLLLALSAALGYLLAGPLVRSAFSGYMERVVIYALLGVIAFSWVGATLGAMSAFRWWIALGMLLVIAVLVRWRFGVPRSRPQLAYHPLSDVMVLGLLTAATWLFSRPAESFFLTDDSAVYTISGVALARTGSFFPSVDGFGQVQDSFVRTFFTTGPSGVMTRYFGPFYQWHMGYQPVEVGFLPLPKVWTALVVWLFGPAQAPWAAPFFGVLSILLLFFLLRRALGWSAALVTVTLLGVSFPQVWFARFPISEIYTQAVLFGGLYLALLAREHRQERTMSTLFISWSALALGALAILRFESPLLLLVIGALFVLTWRSDDWQRGGDGRRWLLTLVVAAAYGLVITLCVARHYMFDLSLGLMTPRNIQRLLALTLIAAPVGWLAYRSWQSDARVRHIGLAVVRRLPLLIALAWVLWAVLTVWSVTTRPWGSTLPGWIVLYWSRPGLTASVAGILLFLWQQQRRMTNPELVILLGLAAPLLLLYSAHPMVTPVQPWAMRRLVPAVIPALALGGGALLAEGLGILRRLAGSVPAIKVATSASYGLLGLVLASQGLLVGQRTAPILLHREAEGFYAQLQAFAQTLPEGAVVFFDNGDVGRRLPQAMELAFQYPSVSVMSLASQESQDLLNHLTESARADGRRVFLVVTNGDLMGWPEGWDLVPQGLQTIDTPILMSTEDRIPDAKDVLNRRLSLDVYEVLPHEDAPALAQALDVPLGPGSYPYLQAGFSWWEQDAAGNYTRWTTGDGLVTIPWPGPTTDDPASFCLTLQVAGGRSDGSQPAQLVVEAEGIELARQELPPGFDPNSVRVIVQGLRNEGDLALEIRLRSDTWLPDSQRELGVLLSDLQVTPLEQCLND